MNKFYVFEIPTIERYIFIGNKTEQKEIMYIDVDGIGMTIHYDNKEQLNYISLDECIPTLREVSFIVEAVCCKDAVWEFITTSKGVKTGGEFPESRAIWINRNKAILELPYCKFMEMDENGIFTCSHNTKSQNNSNGKCIIENSNPPFNCRIALFKENLYSDYERYYKHAIRIHENRLIKIPHNKPYKDFSEKHSVK